MTLCAAPRARARLRRWPRAGPSLNGRSRSSWRPWTPPGPGRPADSTRIRSADRSVPSAPADVEHTRGVDRLTRTGVSPPSPKRARTPVSPPACSSQASGPGSNGRPAAPVRDGWPKEASGGPARECNCPPRARSTALRLSLLAAVSSWLHALSETFRARGHRAARQLGATVTEASTRSHRSSRGILGFPAEAPARLRASRRTSGRRIPCAVAASPRFGSRPPTASISTIAQHFTKRRKKQDRERLPLLLTPLSLSLGPGRGFVGGPPVIRSSETLWHSRHYRVLLVDRPGRCG